MPKWCFNGLEVTGPDDDIQAFSVMAAGEDHAYRDAPGGDRRSILAFHQLVPVPDHLLAGPSAPDDVRPEVVLGTAAGDLLPLDQVEQLDGWHAEIALWGVTGGACYPRLLAREAGRITYIFETAWAPPITLLRRVSQAFPTLTFALAFAELENGVRGLVSVKQGRVTTEALPNLDVPELEDFDDDVAYEESLEAFFSAYDDHVYALVRAEPTR